MGSQVIFSARDLDEDHHPGRRNEQGKVPLHQQATGKTESKEEPRAEGAAAIPKLHGEEEAGHQQRHMAGLDAHPGHLTGDSRQAEETKRDSHRPIPAPAGPGPVKQAPAGQEERSGVDEEVVREQQAIPKGCQHRNPSEEERRLESIAAERLPKAVVQVAPQAVVVEHRALEVGRLRIE